MPPVLQWEPPRNLSPEAPMNPPSSGVDLGVEWESPWREFLTSARDFIRGPRLSPDAQLPADSALQPHWIDGRLPGKAFLASGVWHIAAIWILTLPLWRF